LAVDNAMVYVTGGPAWGRIHGTAHIVNSSGVARGDANSNSTQWGMAAGAGVEFATDQHWSGRGEDLYTTHTDHTGEPSSDVNCTGNFKCRIGYGLSTHEARIAVNYRFH